VGGLRDLLGEADRRAAFLGVVERVSRRPGGVRDLFGEAFLGLFLGVEVRVSRRGLADLLGDELFLGRDLERDWVLVFRSSSDEMDMRREREDLTGDSESPSDSSTAPTFLRGDFSGDWLLRRSSARLILIANRLASFFSSSLNLLPPACFSLKAVNRFRSEISS
jgi:hypothetical protein